MNLKEFLQLILKRLQILIPLTILGAVLAGLVTLLFIKPVYQSTSSVYVLSNRTSPNDSIAYNELLASQLLVNDCREYIKSRAVLEKVVDDLDDPSVTVESLLPIITVRSKNDTRIVEILANGTDRETVYRINTSLTKRFVSGAQHILKLDNISIIDPSSYPLKPIGPNKVLNIFIGGFVGLGLSLFAVLAVEYLDTSIKSPEDVEKYLGLPVIGKIPTVD